MTIAVTEVMAGYSLALAVGVAVGLSLSRRGFEIIISFHLVFFFFSSRRRHTRLQGDWSSDVCSSDLLQYGFATRTFYSPHWPRIGFGADDSACLRASLYQHVRHGQSGHGDWIGEEIGRASCRERV